MARLTRDMSLGGGEGSGTGLHLQGTRKVQRGGQITVDRYLQPGLFADGETGHNAFVDRGYAMRIRYFESTDTLLIEFSEGSVAQSHDLDENTILDMDAHGNVCAITVEHASRVAGVAECSYERVAA